MQTLSEIRALLDSHGLAPKKSLGQNFLIDHNLIRKLVDASGVKAGDFVLEVGPGTGTLTEDLLSRGCEVVACELDNGLAALNRERLGGNPAYADRFTLIEGDCLESKREMSRQIKRALAGRPFTLVANLPYGAATPLMMTLLIDHPECGGMFVTIQREVAERLMAGPGDDAYGQISVVARAAAAVSLVATLPKECFWPRPDVTSAMVALVRRERALTEDLAGLAAFAQRVFGQRRKQLGSVVGRGIDWPPGVEPMMRAEELDVDRMIRLWRAAERERGPEAGEMRGGGGDGNALR